MVNKNISDSKSALSSFQERELREIKRIEDRIETLTQKLIEKTPVKFKVRDYMHDFFASLIVGLTIIFKGHLYLLEQTMSTVHFILVIASTIAILTAAIYFGSYIHISNREGTPFLKFWISRIFANYAIAMIVSFFLISVFGFNSLLATPFGLLKVTIGLAMPCSIGAAIPSLLKEY